MNGSVPDLRILGRAEFTRSTPASGYRPVVVIGTTAYSIAIEWIDASAGLCAVVPSTYCPREAFRRRARFDLLEGPHKVGTLVILRAEPRAGEDRDVFAEPTKGPRI